MKDKEQAMSARRRTATTPWCVAGLFLLGLALAKLVNADTIVRVSNAAPGAGGAAVSSTQYLQQSWTQDAAYQDVRISAWIFGTIVNGAYIPASGTAYLTSSVPTVIELQQTFVSPAPTSYLASSLVTFFEHASLPAGTYYLTLATAGPYSGGWAGGSNYPVSASLGNGVTLGNASFTETGSANPSDPPHSDFTPSNPDVPYFFEVTGQPVLTPEPSACRTLLSGMFGLVLLVGLKRLR